MNQKSNTWKVILGIISAMLAFGNAISAVVFIVLGSIFVSNQDRMDSITVNGEEVTGEEAVELAGKLGKTFLGIGGVTAVLFIAFLVLCIVLLKKASKAKKQMQNGAYYNNMNQRGYNGQMNGQMNGQFNQMNQGFNNQNRFNGQNNQNNFGGQYNQGGFNGQMNGNSNK